jgi:hypothetical protein
MRPPDNVTNYTIGSTNYETDTYSINTCEWLNRTHILFATTEAASQYSSQMNGGAVLTGHTVSPFVSILFSNLIEEISFSQPSFDPSSGQTQQVSAVFANNSDWTLNIEDVYSNVVQTASGSGTSMLYNWDGTSNGTNLPNQFVKIMQYYGWNNSFNKVDDQFSINDLRGSGTMFNNVNMGVLILHGTYGNGSSAIDYAANMCKQMYFPITSGGSAQFLRFSEMNLGGSGTNGLKWMVIDACNSLQHNNWSSMKNKGIKPYNSNLHLILGGDTVTWTSTLKWYNFARYMN